MYCPPTVVVYSVNGTRVFSALAAEWRISTFLTKWKLTFGICARQGGGEGQGIAGWGTAVLKCPSDPPVAMGRGRVDFVAQASLTAMTKSFEWPAAFWGSEALEAWHARFPIRRTTRRQTGKQAGRQASRRSNGNKVEHNYNWNNESRARKPGQVGWSEASSWRRCSSDLNLTMCYYCLPLFAYQIQNDQVQTWIACGSSGCSRMCVWCVWCVCARRCWCRLKNGRKSIWGRRRGTWQQAAKIQQIPNLPCRYSYQYSVCVWVCDCVGVSLFDNLIGV